MSTDAPLAPICERCGYNLTGLAASRCPECGLAFERDVVRVSWVPWVRRMHIGLLPAYLGTCWLLVVHPAAFRREATFGGPLARRSARLFRNITAWITGGSIAALIAAEIWTHGARGTALPLAILYLLLSAAITALAAIGAIECLPAYALQPRDERAHPFSAAVLLYACAPLAMSPLVVILLVFSAWRAGPREQYFPQPWAFWTVPVLLVMWWIVSFRLAWAALDRSAGRLGALAIVVPLAWSMIGAIWLIAMFGIELALTWGVMK